MLNGEIEGTLSAAAERLWALFVPAIIDSSALIILNRFEGAWQSNLAALSFFQTLLDVDHDAVGLILDDAIPCFHVLLKYEDVVDAFNICRSVGWPFDLILDYIRALLRFLSPSLSPPSLLTFKSHFYFLVGFDTVRDYGMKFYLVRLNSSNSSQERLSGPI